MRFFGFPIQELVSVLTAGSLLFGIFSYLFNAIVIKPLKSIIETLATSVNELKDQMEGHGRDYRKLEKRVSKLEWFTGLEKKDNEKN
ncbi:hypothetical protein [Enterococcus sp. HY326]|uniref:hypothetical protein n=1 Tax=Enterococcus sp. HY326 TaxID=2971265 RepID=UPI00223FE3E8|nr:hypothetical protein [Enterococcus sp. HY326]